MERILHVIGRTDVGGAEALIMSVYRRIDREKVQFDFLTYYEDGAYIDEIRMMGGQVFVIPRPGISIFRNLAALKRFFNEHEYRVVHGHLDTTAFFYLRVAKKHGAQVRIAHSHNSNAGGGIKGICRDIAHIPIKWVATNLVACSKEAGEWCFGKRQVRNGNVHVIHNSTDPQLFCFNCKTRSDIRFNMGVKDQLVLGHVGYFIEQKNHEFLIDVYREIKKAIPDAVLWLIGKGPLMDEIKRKAEALPLEDSVVFLGARNNVNEYLQAMDMFLFPSLYEGLSVALVEAQAAGLRCLVSDKISPETKVTELLEFLPIDEVASWTQRVIELQDECRVRQDTTRQIEDAGFTTKQTMYEWGKLYGIAL